MNRNQRWATHTRGWAGIASVSLLLVLACACARDPQQAAQRHLGRGDAYLEEGKVAEAVIEYRNAVAPQGSWTVV